MNEQSHSNSVPWMYAIGPKNPLVELNESDLTESANCVHSWYGVGVTAFIHGTELMWLRKVMVRSWCDRVHSWYGIDVTACIHGTEFLCTLYSVHCTVVINLANFLKHNIKNPPNLIHKKTALTIMTCKTGATLSKSPKVTLRSWCNLVKWP